MLEQLPGAAQLDEDGRAALVRRADGVPLFLEELAPQRQKTVQAFPRAAMPATLSK